MISRILGAAVTVLLVTAALGLGGWFVFAQVKGATLIIFQTGSMAPTMPQGSLAITVPARATELEVGDVVTIQRAGESKPVTHRIMAIGPVHERPENSADIRAAAPGSGPPDLSSDHARQIEMQGDDNTTPDHLPYALTDAYIVVFAVPYLGTVLMLLQTPLGTGLMILLVATLVVGALWPRRATESVQKPAAKKAKHAL